MLEVVNIKKSFKDAQILGGLSLNVKKGEFVSVMGVSGSGKTTLFNIIAGLTPPDEGRVLLDGKDVTNTSGYLAYMQQDDLLFPWKTVIDNVSMPLTLKGMAKREARRRAGEYFELFGLTGYEKSYPHELSGGMRQRAALLRTYLFSGDYALLDEPFAKLDAITKNKMRLWISEVLQRLGCGMLFVTHDIDEALILSDRIYVLSDKPAIVRKEITVDLPKVKSLEMTTTPLFNERKKEILTLLM